FCLGRFAMDRRDCRRKRKCRSAFISERDASARFQRTRTWLLERNLKILADCTRRCLFSCGVIGWRVEKIGSETGDHKTIPGVFANHIRSGQRGLFGFVRTRFDRLQTKSEALLARTAA